MSETASGSALTPQRNPQRTPVIQSRMMAAQGALAAAGPTAPAVLAIFMLCLIPPGYFYLLGIRLSLIRILLMILFIPLLGRLFTGRSGKIRSIDIFLMLYSFWVLVTLVINNGLDRIPLAAITMVELFGAYLIGRTLVRNEADFKILLRYFIYLLIFLSPFALIELISDRNLLQEGFGKIMPTYFKGESSYGRLGLNRVMSVFEHPILFGIFCSIGFAPIFYSLQKGAFRLIVTTGLVGLMAFASLSSAPLLALAVQIGLIGWGWLMKARWWLLFGIVSFCYVTVDLLSNRTPITILINYITFDPNTAWTRVMTWRFGVAEVLRHPVFGIGLNDWERPYWLTGSVDNFWLLNAMRHGLPGVCFLILGVASGFWAVARVRDLSDRIARHRLGYLISLVALYFSMATVHVWGGVGSFLMLFIGAGMWFCDSAGSCAAVAGPQPEDGVSESIFYSRFPVSHSRRQA